MGKGAHTLKGFCAFNIPGIIPSLLHTFQSASKVD